MRELEDDFLETFRAALSGAARAIAGEAALDIGFADGGRASHSAGTVRVPRPDRAPPAEQVAVIRGTADGFALMRRFHDAALHGQLCPSDPTPSAILSALEQVRVEALGSRDMDGVAANLRASVEAGLRTEAIAFATEPAQVPLAAALPLLVRERLTGEPMPHVARAAVGLVRTDIERKAAPDIANLTLLIEDQAAFMAQAIRILELLGVIFPEPTQALGPGETGGVLDQGAVRVEPQPEETDDVCEEQERHGFEDGHARARRPLRKMAPDFAYRAYTTGFDEEVAAASLCSEDVLQRLCAELAGRLTNLQGVVSKLANRLQRRLLSQQPRHWEFDQEEGLLDAARLARAVTNPMTAPVYKIEKEALFRDTLVTLLIDNSGSMRGNPISIAAISADILTRTLERCGVRTEILGFTTISWDGGRSREDWLRTRQPRPPGRLNDVRHIIYKHADEPWRRARRNLGVMIMNELLKENIDGEALLWAHERMMARRESRRILVVISDGAPIDEATADANPGSYLEDHLRQVIRWIETTSPVQLVAIGIRHDVARYYKRAVKIAKAEELGATLVDQLAKLFDQAGGSPRHP